MTTEEKLLSITDRAEFERLAAAILRVKFPTLSNLIESGLNEKGETVKSPVDGFAKTGESEYCYIEYTTDDTNLKEKWLHDTSKYKGKKEKDSRPEGDLLKACKLANNLLNEVSGAACTIYLVTNQRVSPDLFNDVQVFGRKNNVSVEVVELSILADHLDNTGHGHWLRKRFFNIEADLLSKELFLEISKINIEIYKAELFIDENNIIVRKEYSEVDDILRNSEFQLHFISGDSGMGKSTFSYLKLSEHIKLGNLGLRLTPEIIIDSSDIETAIFSQLRKTYPSILNDISFLKEILKGEHEIILVIDDVNSFSNTKRILEKIISWSNLKNRQNYSRISILCPIWPQFFDHFQRQDDKNKTYSHSYLKTYNQKDSSYHLNNVIESAQITLSELQKKAILNDLGFDPLLIGLFAASVKVCARYEDLNVENVLIGYLQTTLESLSFDNNTTSNKFWHAIELLGYSMLANKNINPTYQNIKSWITDQGVIDNLELISTKRRIFTINTDGQLKFRHDRVRDGIMSYSLKQAITKSSILEQSDIITDPFFSQISANATKSIIFSEEEMDYLIKEIPVLLFLHRVITEDVVDSEYSDALMKKLNVWSNISIGKDLVPESVIYDILKKLCYLDSKVMNQITKNFPDTNNLVDLARFKNGDTFGGLRYLSRFRDFEPGMGNYLRDEMINHAKTKFFSKIENDLSNFLEQELIKPTGNKFIYLLIGYWGSSKLVPKMYNKWLKYPDRQNDDLIYVLWATLICFEEQTKDNLEKLLDFYDALADEGHEDNGLPKGLKNSLSHTLSYCRLYNFNDYQINFLNELRLKGKGLNIIHVIFSKLDHPVALNYLIKKKAEILEKYPKSVSAMQISINRFWDPKTTGGRQMARTGLDFLKSIWQEKTRNKHERILAFRNWADSVEESHLIKETQYIQSDDEDLFKESVHKRILAGDGTVKNAALELAKEYPRSLSLLHNIWDADIFNFIDNYIESKDKNSFYELSDLFYFLPEDDAERLILKHWNKLKDDNFMIYVSLFIASPTLLELCHKEVINVADKITYFKYVNHLYGGFQTDKRDKITIRKLNSLVPYIEYISDFAIDDFAGYCQNFNCQWWARKHLYERMDTDKKKHYFPSDQDLLTELKDLSKNRKTHLHIDHWCEELEKRLCGYDRTIKILELFCQKEHSLMGFLAVARCLEKLGKRKDLKILDTYVLEKGLIDNVDKEKSDVEYAVKINSLD